MRPIAFRAARIFPLFIWLCVAIEPSSGADAQPSSINRPTIGELMGINGHTVSFRPELYAPVCRRVRDYHPVDWDVNGDPSHATTFPMAANGVDWAAVYGSWLKSNFEIDACLQFDPIPFGAWKEPAREARVYGEAFAKAFGPSGSRKLVTSVEIGNEPSKYTPDQYRAIFEPMARGLRKGDPKLLIATCAVLSGKTDEWSKPTSAIDGLETLYDVLNVHSYAFASGWPTWKRSFPEDPSIDYLKHIQSLISWRDQHARGKLIWLTEFGYDAATHPPATDGPWSQWVGVSDSEQARYIVRSFLIFSSMGIDRAYLYFFNDSDEAQLHGASGITRGFKPKPSYYAMEHLFKTLGSYRFERAVLHEEGRIYCFAYVNGDQRIYVAWRASGSGLHAAATLQLGHDATRIERADQMPGTSSIPAKVSYKAAADGSVALELTETPVFLFVR